MSFDGQLGDSTLIGNSTLECLLEPNAKKLALVPVTHPVPHLRQITDQTVFLHLCEPEAKCKALVA